MTTPHYAHHTFSPWTCDGDRRIVAAPREWLHAPTWNIKAGAAGQTSRVHVPVDVFEEWQGAEGEGEMTCYKTGEPLSVNKNGHVWPVGWPSMSDGDDWGIKPYTIQDVRHRLFHLIDNASHLNWMLELNDPIRNASRVPGIGDCPDECTPLVRPNLWLGVHVRTQADADRLIPPLLRVPAAMRFVRVTPEEEIDLDVSGAFRSPHGCDGASPDPECELCKSALLGVDLLIVDGGEKPMHPQHVRSLRDQAVGAGCPFWFESHGEWEPWNENTGPCPDSRPCGFWTNADVFHESETPHTGRQSVVKVGRDHSGRTLDGRTWDEVP